MSLFFAKHASRSIHVCNKKRKATHTICECVLIEKNVCGQIFLCHCVGSILRDAEYHYHIIKNRLIWANKVERNFFSISKRAILKA